MQMYSQSSPTGLYMYINNEKLLRKAADAALHSFSLFSSASVVFFFLPFFVVF